MTIISNALNYKFIRFILVGILNTVFGYSAFALFVFLGLHYTAAVFFATILGILFNFKTFGKLVFKNPYTDFNYNLIFKFFMGYVILYFINIILIKLFILIFKIFI